MINKQYCYILLDDNRNILYIGRTDDLLKRMRGHLDIVNAETILIIECNNIYEVKYVEAYLINLYEPPFNSIIPRKNKVISHLDELKKHNAMSKFITKEDFGIDWEIPLSELDKWSRKHVSTKHQIAVYLSDDEYNLFKEYCGSASMAGIIKKMLDNNILNNMKQRN